MSQSPSPIYLLLTNPGWEATAARAEVLEGVAGAWSFDANETHDGKALLPLLLQRWHEQSREEKHLLPIVEALLRRGADPGAGLASIEQARKVNWHYYTGVQSLLLGAQAGLDMAQAILGARLLCLMGQALGAPETRKAMEAELGHHDGWKTTLHGLPAVAWLALQVCDEGPGMRGWTLSHQNATTEHYARQIRQMRAIASASNPESMGEEARFVLACGLLLAAGYGGRSQAQKDASQTLETQALKLLAHIDTDALPEMFERIARHPPFQHPGFAARMAMAAIKGVAPCFKDKDTAWTLVAKALPHLYDNGRFACDDDSLDGALNPDAGVPPAEFFEALPPTDRHHDAMMRILTGQFRRTLHGKDADFRDATLQLLEDMLPWAQRGQLAGVDLDYYISQNHGLQGRSTTIDALRHYNERVMSQTQGEQLSERTPQVVNRAPSRRI